MPACVSKLGNDWNVAAYLRSQMFWYGNAIDPATKELAADVLGGTVPR